MSRFKETLAKEVERFDYAAEKVLTVSHPGHAAGLTCTPALHLRPRHIGHDIWEKQAPASVGLAHRMNEGIYN